MIKLILSDLDGTLVNSNKEIPKEFYQVYEQLQQQGVIFGLASGRSYSSMRRDFSKIADEGFFIAEGGSLVIYQGEVISKTLLERNNFLTIMQQVSQIPNSVALACSVDCCYTLSLDNDDYKKEIMRYHSKHIEVNSFEEIPDNIVKVSIFLEDYNADEVLEQLRFLEDSNTLVQGGKEWIDILVPGVSKATGIPVACELLDITSDQIMAFGDYLNDYELLRALKYSYAMENAHPEIKKVCNYHCPSNDDNGVIKTIQSIFNL